MTYQSSCRKAATRSASFCVWKRAKWSLLPRRTGGRNAGGCEHFFRQRKIPKQSHGFFGEHAPPPCPAGSGRWPVTANHPESGCAYETTHGVQLRKGKNAGRRNGVLPLQENIKQNVGIEENTERLSTPEMFFQVMEYRAAKHVLLPARKSSPSWSHQTRRREPRTSFPPSATGLSELAVAAAGGP